MLKNLLFLFFAVALITSCNSQSSQGTNPNQFGEAITSEGSISYAELIKKLETNESVETKVVGTVNSVCQVKGCWMTIVSDDTNTEMRVKFKDYGFFVPKDLSGKKVVFEGKASIEVTPVAELKHLAEDAGQSKEEIESITEPEEGYNFLASGVLILEQ